MQLKLEKSIKENQEALFQEVATYLNQTKQLYCKLHETDVGNCTKWLSKLSQFNKVGLNKAIQSLFTQPTQPVNVSFPKKELSAVLEMRERFLAYKTRFVKISFLENSLSKEGKILFYSGKPSLSFANRLNSFLPELSNSDKKEKEISLFVSLSDLLFSFLFENLNEKDFLKSICYNSNFLNVVYLLQKSYLDIVEVALKDGKQSTQTAQNYLQDNALSYYADTCLSIQKQNPIGLALASDNIGEKTGDVDDFSLTDFNNPTLCSKSLSYIYNQAKQTLPSLSLADISFGIWSLFNLFNQIKATFAQESLEDFFAKNEDVKAFFDLLAEFDFTSLDCSLSNNSLSQESLFNYIHTVSYIDTLTNRSCFKPTPLLLATLFATGVKTEALNETLGEIVNLNSSVVNVIKSDNAFSNNFDDEFKEVKTGCQNLREFCSLVFSYRKEILALNQSFLSEFDILPSTLFFPYFDLINRFEKHSGNGLDTGNSNEVNEVNGSVARGAFDKLRENEAKQLEEFVKNNNNYSSFLKTVSTFCFDERKTNLFSNPLLALICSCESILLNSVLSEDTACEKLFHSRNNLISKKTIQRLNSIEFKSKENFDFSGKGCKGGDETPLTVFVKPKKAQLLQKKQQLNNLAISSLLSQYNGLAKTSSDLLSPDLPLKLLNGELFRVKVKNESVFLEKDGFVLSPAKAFYNFNLSELVFNYRMFSDVFAQELKTLIQKIKDINEAKVDKQEVSNGVETGCVEAKSYLDSYAVSKNIASVHSLNLSLNNALVLDSADCQKQPYQNQLSSETLQKDISENTNKLIAEAVDAFSVKVRRLISLFFSFKKPSDLALERQKRLNSRYNKNEQLTELEEKVLDYRKEFENKSENQELFFLTNKEQNQSGFEILNKELQIFIEKYRLLSKQDFLERKDIVFRLRFMEEFPLFFERLCFSVSKVLNGGKLECARLFPIIENEQPYSVQQKDLFDKFDLESLDNSLTVSKNFLSSNFSFFESMLSSIKCAGYETYAKTNLNELHNSCVLFGISDSGIVLSRDILQTQESCDERALLEKGVCHHFIQLLKLYNFFAFTYNRGQVCFERFDEYVELVNNNHREGFDSINFLSKQDSVFSLFDLKILHFLREKLA